jgi:hypothetical protein
MAKIDKDLEGCGHGLFQRTIQYVCEETEEYSKEPQDNDSYHI